LPNAGIEAIRTVPPAREGAENPSVLQHYVVIGYRRRKCLLYIST
jgi:hypothetical protein